MTAQAVADWRPIVARYKDWLQREEDAEKARRYARRQRGVALAELRNLGLTLDELGELFGMSRENARKMIASVGGDDTRLRS
jgi:hypothetical protein